MTRTVGITIGTIGLAALLLASCGDDGGSDAEDASVEAGTGGTGQDGPDPEEASCLLTSDVVGEAAGTDVTFDSVSVGGFGSGSADASFGPDGAEASSEAGASVAWQGCTYLASDDEEYLVGELVTEDGDPDPAGVDRLSAEAEADAGAEPDVGDDAFVDEDDLVILAGQRTLVVGFSSGSNPTPEDMTQLADLAGSLVDGDHGDMVSMCQAATTLVPAAWAPAGTPLTGSGSGSVDGVEYSYESCSIDLLDGAAGLDMQLGDEELFDLRVADAGTPGDDLPELVEGIGDAAVRVNDRLFVKVGDRAIVTSVTVESTDPDGNGDAEAGGGSQPADAVATTEALAEAAADSLG